ncbi:MAG: hypothetical protein OIF38_04465, partial [Cellvibrionaceae bacterium]|nr:hypothetical protein [Cellvibrionaceae bacterium]
LLFAGNNSLLSISPAQYRAWQYQPPLVISSLFKNGQLQSWRGAPIIIETGDYSFAVDVAALDYSDSSRNRYRYRLRGFAEQWLEVDSEHRRIQYTKLPPGQYQLEVQGSNRLGQWSLRHLNIDVIVVPAWYQSWWFKLLLVLLAAVLTYGVILWRTRRLRHQKLKLER